MASSLFFQKEVGGGQVGVYLFKQVVLAGRSAEQQQAAGQAQHF